MFATGCDFFVDGFEVGRFQSGFGGRVAGAAAGEGGEMGENFGVGEDC